MREGGEGIVREYHTLPLQRRNLSISTPPWDDLESYQKYCPFVDVFSEYTTRINQKNQNYKPRRNRTRTTG